MKNQSRIARWVALIVVVCAVAGVVALTAVSMMNTDPGIATAIELPERDAAADTAASEVPVLESSLVEPTVGSTASAHR